jgi:hypothetical protein
MNRYSVIRPAVSLGLLSIVVLSGCGSENKLVGPSAAAHGSYVRMPGTTDRLPQVIQKPAPEPMPVGQIQTDYIGEWANEESGAQFASLEILASVTSAQMRASGEGLNWGADPVTATRVGADLVASFTDTGGNPHMISSQYNNASGTELKVVEVAPSNGGTHNYVFSGPASPFVGEWTNDERPGQERALRYLNISLTNHGQKLFVVTDAGSATTFLYGGEILALVQDGMVAHRLSFTVAGDMIKVVDVAPLAGGMSTYYFKRHQV